MSEITEFFSGVFDTDKWPPRWKCGEWSDFMGWMYIGSELMIWTAYFLIPLLIINYFANKRALIKFQRVYVLFASFILLCGSTHFLDAMMFWIPMYRFNALVRLATGIVSLFTVYHLFKILPQVFKQKTSVELENEIARREAAELKLAEANKNLEAFAYIASHDLQEPLRKIRTFSNLLYNANIEKFDENSRKYIGKLVDSSSRMQGMIQDVLTLSTLSEDVEMTTVLPAQAIEGAMENLEIRILESGATINVGELPAVTGNLLYLSQLFMNLISNAIKFSTTQPEINITGKVLGGMVQITFTDKGIGMNEADLNKIFQPFQRLHSKTEYEGSGIGLSICKKIVVLHQGDIQVTSTPGVGTTFVVTLPAA